MSTNIESIEDSFYLFLGLHCSKCANDYYPQEESSWDESVVFGEIPDKLKDEYSTIALEKGWVGKNYDSLLCPECK